MKNLVKTNTLAYFTIVNNEEKKFYKNDTRFKRPTRQVNHPWPYRKKLDYNEKSCEDKHSSLFVTIIINVEKSFIRMTQDHPWPYRKILDCNNFFFKNKHSSLLFTAVSDTEKKSFIVLAPG